MDKCDSCGCTPAQIRADARNLGLEDEFKVGTYSCCQIVGWADDQWSAWAEAAAQDGKEPGTVTKPLELMEF
jgi:hypothetical protein